MDPTHLAATLEWLRDVDLRRALDSLDEPTGRGNREYWRARWADPRAESYAIVDAKGEHVGNCGLRDIDSRRRKAELWIYVAKQRGRGVGAAAVAALLDRAFGQLGLNRVYLRVVAHNISAYRFYLRLGFVAEGRARADTWWGDEPVDATLMSILAVEHARGEGSTR
jgi:RimJ/RimL family protein N-acetyltransferase